jgi:predicted NBD/HSP70 family sugar kinase
VMREYLRHGDRSLAVILMSGAGIGAGFIFGGEPLYGTRFKAGEGGHVILDPNGPRCRAGLNHSGCLETIASARGILQSLGLEVCQLEDGLAVANDRVKQNDAAAKRAFAYAGEQLGQFLASILVLLDPQRLVIYGHQELIDANAYAAATEFRNALSRAMDASLSEEGKQDAIDWRELKTTTNAQAAGTAAMREFLKRPAHWRSSVLATRVLMPNAWTWHAGIISDATPTAASA